MDLQLTTYILIGVIVLLVLWVIRLEVRLSRLLAGKNARTLEDTIVRLRDELTKLFEHKVRHDDKLQDIDTRLSKSVQWVETVRFNPYQNQGGNHSWSTLFLNEQGDGVVITGLWSREKNNVYAKPVRNYTSDHELSVEELGLINKVKA